MLPIDHTLEMVLGCVAAVVYLSCSMCMHSCLPLKCILSAGIPRAALHNPRSGPVHLWSHLVRGDPVPEHHHWLHHGGRAQQAGHRSRWAASHASSCMHTALLLGLFSTVYRQHAGSFVEQRNKLQLKRWGSRVLQTANCRSRQRQGASAPISRTQPCYVLTWAVRIMQAATWWIMLPFHLDCIML